MKFSSKPIEEHVEVPLADEGQWEDLVEHFRRRQMAPKVRGEEGNACYVVSISVGKNATRSDGQLNEILGLVRAQQDRVVGHEIRHIAKPDPRTFLGRGVSREIADRAIEVGADLLVIDAELSPSQMRNLEDAAGLRVSDREAVILNVFLAHAKTRRARIQVEVAQLEYLRPRIRGLGLDMDQQAGGLMNARGPGETASELLARRLDGRLADLRSALSKLRRSAREQRRRRSSAKRIALVGYTNAGKTTLMNALTFAGLSAKNMPFETLDATSRSLTRHGGDVVLSDTVGFIRRLPERLLESFESTLAEVKNADLVAIVIDSSDEEWPLHLSTTEGMLERLGAGETPRFYVVNKLDRGVSGDAIRVLSERRSGNPFFALSGHDKMAVEELNRRLIAAVRTDHRTAQVFVPYSAPAASRLVYANCRILRTDAKASGLLFTLEATPQQLKRIHQAVRERRPE